MVPPNFRLVYGGGPTCHTVSAPQMADIEWRTYSGAKSVYAYPVRGCPAVPSVEMQSCLCVHSQFSYNNYIVCVGRLQCR